MEVGAEEEGRNDGHGGREDEKRMMEEKAKEVRDNVKRGGEKRSETESNPARGERERVASRERGEARK